MEFSMSQVSSLLVLVFVICWIGRAVDACAVMEYDAKCKQCVNTFVDSLQKAPKSNCSMNYVSLRKCISSEMTTCINTPGISNNTIMFIRQRSIVYTATEEFFCNDGMLNSMKNYKRSSLPMCSAKFFRKAAKCGRRFRMKFMRKRGRRSLCRDYHKAKQCMILGLEINCKKLPFLSQLISNYKQPYNPYCKSRRDPERRQRSSAGFGSCTQKGYVLKSRQCIVDFIHTLQRNGGARCRATVDLKLIPCIKRRVKRCLRGTRDAKILERDVSKAFAAQRMSIQNRYCEGGYLETLPLAKSQCSEEYFETFQGRCYRNFSAKYRENKANPLLCQEYAEAKKCARNMTLSLCKLDDSMKDAVHFQYGDFNPFCHDGKDQGNTRSAHDKQTTSTESKACSSHTWGLTTLVTLVVYTMFLS